MIFCNEVKFAQKIMLTENDFKQLRLLPIFAF